jgi:hypothetical protein
MRPSRYLPVLTVLVLAAATPGSAETPRTIACDGPFARDATEADVKAAFGAENTVYTEIDGPEGSTWNATVVFPDDPAKRIDILWNDEAARKGPRASFVMPSAWVGPLGIANGLTLADVEAINGAPFDIAGFGWDYGGSASFPDGALAAVEGDCFIGANFDLKEYPEDGRFDDLMGDRQMKSDVPLMRKANPVLVEWWIGYPVE